MWLTREFLYLFAAIFINPKSHEGVFFCELKSLKGCRQICRAEQAAFFVWTSCVLFETWSPLETKVFSFSQVHGSCKLLPPFEDFMWPAGLFSPRTELTAVTFWCSQSCEMAPLVLLLLSAQFKLGGDYLSRQLVPSLHF